MDKMIGTHVGFIFDGNDDTPHIAAMLDISKDSIKLEVPLMREVTPAYEAWFTGWSVPKTILFRNVDIAICLTDLRPFQHTSGWGSSHGRGIVEAGCAVSVGMQAPDYQTINGLRSELIGLPAWASPRVFSHRTEVDESARISKVTFECESKPDIDVPGVDGLSLSPHFEFTHDWPNGSHGMRETMQIESKFADPTDWNVHAKLHRTLQDLVSIAYWFPCNLTAKTALREDDPIMTLGGTRHGEQWQDVVVPDFGRRSVRTPIRDIPTHRRPMFYLDEIGVSGLATWFREYQSLGQAMWVLSASLFREGGTVEVTLLQVGTALEALGREIALRNGRLQQGVSDRSFAFPVALRTVADNTDCALDKVLKGQSTAEWAASFNAAYKGVKHADQPLPDPIDAWQRADEGALLARLWLARNLGMDRSTLEERLPGL